MKPNTKRNIDLVRKRRNGWTFRELARFFNISVSTAHEIYRRDEKKYIRKKAH